MNKSKQKNAVKPDLAFQSSTAAADFGYWLVEKACFSFLAVTTGIMTYNAFEGMIKQNVPPKLYYVTVAMVVLAIYLIIDHNLSKNFKEYWKNLSNASDYKNARYVKKFLDITVLFIIIRFGLTITASWWSAGEVADLTTTKPDAQIYLTEISKYDESQKEDKEQALIEMNTLRASEKQRVAEATRAANKLVAAKVSEGSIHQRDMWKDNPTFFDALSPTSKYYTHNKAFADKVHAAQAEAKRMIQAEYDKTKTAENFYYGVTQDTTGKALTNSIANTINNNEEAYNTKLARRTNFVLRLDIVCALIGFIVMRIRYLRRRAGGEEDLTKTFSFILAKAIKNENVKFLEWLEDRLGIDLDGNGQVGTVGNSSPTSIPSNNNGYNSTNINTDLMKSSKQEYYPTPPDQNSNRRLIGFRRGGNTQMKSPSTSTISERESPEGGSPLPWQQQNREKAFNLVQRALNVQTDGTKLVDTRYFKSRMKQTYTRSFEYETEEARHYQHCLYQYFRAELEELGWQISEEEDSHTLNIREA